MSRQNVLVIGDYVEDRFRFFDAQARAGRFENEHYIPFVTCTSSKYGGQDVVLPGGAGNVNACLRAYLPTSEFSITDYVPDRRCSFNGFCYPAYRERICRVRNDGHAEISDMLIHAPGVTEEIVDNYHARIRSIVSDRNGLSAVVLSDYDHGYVTPILYDSLLTMPGLRGCLLVANVRDLPKYKTPRLNVMPSTMVFIVNVNDLSITQSSEDASFTRSLYDVSKTLEASWLCHPDFMLCPAQDCHVHVIVTCGAAGVIHYDMQTRELHTQYAPCYYGVTPMTIGAGDMFTAALAGELLTHPTDSDVPNAIMYALYATYKYVYRSSLTQRFMPYMDDVVNLDSVVAQPMQALWAGKYDFAYPLTNRPLAITNGCFDLFHAGHLAVLTELTASPQEFDAVVLINDDKSVRRLKGDARPYRTLSQRFRDIVAAIGYTRAESRKVLKPKVRLVPFSYDAIDDVFDNLSEIGLYVKGGDYRTDTTVTPKQLLSERNQLKVKRSHFSDYIPDSSTTQIAKDCLSC